MRCFSPLEQRIISILADLKNPSENVFAMVMQPILFSRGIEAYFDFFEKYRLNDYERITS